VAIWQFDFYFLPSSFDADCSLDIEKIDVAWHGDIGIRKFVGLCEQECEAAESWHDDLRVWKGPGDTDINLWVKKNNIDSIHLRIDLRTDFWPFVELWFDVARSLGAKVYCPEAQRVIPPDERQLSDIVVTSSAGRFVVDPRGFLDSLGENGSSGRS